MNPIQITPNLYLIPLDQKLPGFTSFISAWLYKGDKNFLIDVGPASTIPVLVNALEELDIKKLDAIFLTHIHIDHAGGIGDLVSRFPDTRVICHGSGIPHLIAPSRLWKGSLNTLGETARAYGQIQPVPPDLLYDVSDLNHLGTKTEVIPFLTPGHAPHHVSYKLDNYLFAGEAGGVFIDLSDKDSKQDCYLRPATPPKFFMETSIQSLETLMSIPHDLLCYGHFGATTKGADLLEAHKNQLFLWKDIIQEQMSICQEDELMKSCLDMLLEKDPMLTGWHNMEHDIRERERGFLCNSIRGFLGYLHNNT